MSDEQRKTNNYRAACCCFVRRWMCNNHTLNNTYICVLISNANNFIRTYSWYISHHMRRLKFPAAKLLMWVCSICIGHRQPTFLYLKHTNELPLICISITCIVCAAHSLHCFGSPSYCKIHFDKYPTFFFVFGNLRHQHPHQKLVLFFLLKLCLAGQCVS